VSGTKAVLKTRLIEHLNGRNDDEDDDCDDEGDGNFDEQDNDESWVSMTPFSTTQELGLGDKEIESDSDSPADASSSTQDNHQHQRHQRTANNRNEHRFLDGNDITEYLEFGVEEDEDEED
jgi:hypothetical protein